MAICKLRARRAETKRKCEIYLEFVALYSLREWLNFNGIENVRIGCVCIFTKVIRPSLNRLSCRDLRYERRLLHVIAAFTYELTDDKPPDSGVSVGVTRVLTFSIFSLAPQSESTHHMGQ